jgi:hypothetical protein
MCARVVEQIDGFCPVVAFLIPCASEGSATPTLIEAHVKPTETTFPVSSHHLLFFEETLGFVQADGVLLEGVGRQGRGRGAECRARPTQRPRVQVCALYLEGEGVGWEDEREELRALESQLTQTLLDLIACFEMSVVLISHARARTWGAWLAGGGNIARVLVSEGLHFVKLQRTHSVWARS